jgi:hypothetical protein
MSPATSIRVGDPVRVFFGAESRDGTIEHIGESADREPAYLIRISPGWCHLAHRDDFICKPRPLPPMPFPVAPWSAAA